MRYPMGSLPCSALANYETAVEVICNDQHRIIAHKLLKQVPNNVTVGRHKKENARAKMKALMRHIFRRFGYPPDLSKEAVQVDLEQAESLRRDIA